LLLLLLLLVVVVIDGGDAELLRVTVILRESTLTS